MIINEHTTAPLSSPVVRGIENISFVHVDGDFTYIQRYQDQLKVEKLSETLSKLCGNVVYTDSILIIGKVYMFESHGKYYRCVVKSTDSTMVIVHCIDFGYEKQIEKKKLQYLEDTKLSSLPALIIIVKTSPMSFNTSNTPFLVHLHVDSDGSPNITPNNRSLLLKSENELIKTLENGCLVKVTHVYSNNDCWIVPHLFFDRLKTISQELVKMQSKIIPVETEIGSLCAALHSKTKQWHRALILDKDEENGNMLAIDSGERFIALKTTRLVSEIQKIPNCALHCRFISNVDIKTFLNKKVRCKLISYAQPLLEVELLTNNPVTVIMPTQPNLEWVVTISSFESFKKFSVKQFNDNQLNSIADKLEDFTQQPPIGTLVVAITDKDDNVWYECEVLSLIDHLDLFSNAIVRILKNGSICKTKKIKILPGYMSSLKSSYCCSLEKEVEDDIITSVNLVNIRKMMMKFQWIMKTTSENEPYKVTLTNNGLDCIDVLHNNLFINDPIIPEINADEYNMDNIEFTNVTNMENLSNDISRENAIIKDIILPSVETVIIKQVDTFQYFYVYSKSLSELYIEKINSNLEISIIELSLNYNMVGTIVVTSSKVMNSWCRAKIDQIYPDNHSARCYLVDYGFYERCYEFYKPTDFLCLCPPIVRRCSLYAPLLLTKKNEIWFPNIDSMFKDVININNIQFDMIIKEDGDPCIVTLLLDNCDINKILHPIHVQVTYINSLLDFKIKALTSSQKEVDDYVNSITKMINNVPSMVKCPKIDMIYLGYSNSNFKRVQFNSFSDSKYIVFDIDDTLDVLSLDSLYELPQNIRDIPFFTMSCSLILNNPEEYSLSNFLSLMKNEVTFIMCIITESSDGKEANLVKLYYDNKDVLDILKNE